MELLWELFRLLGALPGLSGGTLGGQQASEDTPGLPLREGPENGCEIGTYLGGANVAQVLIIIYPRERGTPGRGTQKAPQNGGVWGPQPLEHRSGSARLSGSAGSGGMDSHPDPTLTRAGGQDDGS